MTLFLNSPSVEQRSSLFEPNLEDIDLALSSFYPQTASWTSEEATEEQNTIEEVPDQTSDIMEKVGNVLEKSKSTSFKETSDFINLLSQLNRTLETLKYQGKVYKSGKNHLSAFVNL